MTLSKRFSSANQGEMNMTTGIDVLIVEDNPASRKLLEDVLSVAGFRYLALDNAEDGIHEAQKHTPRFILMDIMLPGMNGLVATNLLKQIDVLAETKIIGMSAHAMKTETEVINQANFDLFLTKPFSYKRLLRFLHSMS